MTVKSSLRVINTYKNVVFFLFDCRPGFYTLVIWYSTIDVGDINNDVQCGNSDITGFSIKNVDIENSSDIAFPKNKVIHVDSKRSSPFYLVESNRHN